MTDDANAYGEDPRFKHRRTMPDPRGLLAVLSVIAAFALQGYITWACTGVPNCDTTMPPWVVGLVSAIVAFYFGYKASGNGSGTGIGGPGGVGGPGGGTGGPGGPGGRA
jgi:hypothetical protein